MKQATRGYQQKPLDIHLIKRFREALLIIVGAIALFLLLSLITYHASDPGWSHFGQNLHIANKGGKLGAILADILLYMTGYLAYLFPFMVFYAAWFYYQDRQQQAIDYYFILLKSAGFFLVFAAGAGLVSSYFTGTGGGVLGSLVSKSMANTFGHSGAALILFALFLSGVTLFTGLSWLKVVDRCGQWVWMVGGLLWQKRQEKKQNNEAGRIEPKIKPPTKAPEKKIEPRVRIEPRLTSSATEKPTVEIATKVAKPQVISPGPRVDQERQAALFDLPAKGGLPPLSLLDPPDKTIHAGYTHQQLEDMSKEVELRFQDFGIDVKVVAVHPGPVVTRFELQLAAGTKVSKISTLAKDLARSLSVVSVRVVEVIPGKSVIGLELPNEHREVVRLREILSSQQYDNARSPLTLALGKDIAGHPVIVDLAKMPHLLVAGTTGSGKSVGLNAMLLSLLYKTSPEQLRMILIDPKMLELAVYEGIPHLLTPVVTDMKDAANALRWCVAEMERRYRLMASMGVRNLSGYNIKIKEAAKNGAPLLDPLWQAGLGDQPQPLEELPYIMVLIDEFADMMMVVGKKVEELIARIAQKARAAGIHLILATQRPSVDVITGLIKANIPTRISFQVSSKIDSRTILDQQGADQLLGHGDMLYLAPGTGVPVRVHGAFVADDEVHRVVQNLKQTGQPSYQIEILEGANLADLGLGPGISGEGGEFEGEQDPLYDQAVGIVLESRRASISHVQRRLKIGFNRAANIMETMEKAGLVSAMEQNGVREVLVPQED